MSPSRSLHRLENSKSKEILSYDGNSKYDDGDQIPVIDAEMPEIQRLYKAVAERSARCTLSMDRWLGPTARSGV
jgi:hypothetical protein